MKSGFVSIVGRPNTGKSTLMNTVLKKHIAIVSDVAGTTRNAIQGVYNDKDTQIIFVDTPGIHKPKDKLGKYLNKQTYESLEDIDVILFVVDASAPLGRGDTFISQAFKNNDIPVILVLNKIDKLSDEQILKAINSYKELYDYFDGKISLEEAKDLIKKRSRHYAKRQYTWFNNQMDVKWFNVNFENFDNTIKEVENYLDV